MNAQLKDLRTELWLRRRNSGELTWTTKEGKVIPIKDMTDTHLKNTIKMIERNIADDDSDLYPIYTEEEWRVIETGMGMGITFDDFYKY